MTVAELIQQLQQLPPQARVLLLLGRNELANGKECRAAEIVEAWRQGHRRDWTATDWLEPDPDDEQAEPVQVVVNLIT